MKTVEVKVSELEGAALDWAVAQVEGVKTLMMEPRKDEPKKPFALFGSLALSVGGDDQSSYAPSSCWHCAGPLLDKHCKSFGLVQDGLDKTWRAFGYGDQTPDGTNRFQRLSSGGTILVAACRAIVAANLGDTVQIPAELA